MGKTERRSGEREQGVLILLASDADTAFFDMSEAERLVYPAGQRRGAVVRLEMAGVGRVTGLVIL